MRNKSRFLVLLLVSLVLGSVIRIAVIRGEDARKAPAGALEVSIASPRGDIPVLHSIDVVFSSPMVPLGSRGEGAGTIPPPLEIDPAPPGAFTWIGTRALSFVPSGEIEAGSVLTCRVRKGVRSLDGKETAFDFTWQIIVARPGLLASVPGGGAAMPAGEAVYLLFSIPPAAGAADSVRLVGPSGVIHLTRIEADSQAVKEMIPREQRREPGARETSGAHGTPGSSQTPESNGAPGSSGMLGPENILALRPDGTMQPDGDYRIEIASGVPFAGSHVGLAAPAVIPFRTYGEARPVTASADAFGLSVTLAGPVDPDSLRAYLTIRPSIGAYSIRPESGTAVRIEKGRIRGGTTYTLRFRAGLPSLLGERLRASQSIQASVPHRDAELRIEPGDGYVPLEKGVSIRMTGLNVDSVHVTGRWIPPEEIPALVARGYGAGDLPRDLPRIATWLEPKATPESLRTAQIPIERFGPRPAEGRALAIRVTARGLFHLFDQRSYPPLGDNGFVQITDLGLSTFAGAEGGIAWATRLSTGQPIAGATVSIQAAVPPGAATPGEPAAPVPLWSGKTDADGLVRIPPLAEMSIPANAELVASVRTEDDAAWLRIPFDRSSIHEAGVRPEETTIFTFNDRPLYRPGETVRWVSLARRATARGIAATSRSSAVYRVQAPDGRQLDIGDIALTPPGDGSASFTIPQGAAPGSYSIVFAASRDEKAPRIGFKGFQVEEYRLPRFQARVTVPTEPVISGTTIHAEGRFAYLNGGPLAGMPVVWTITRRAEWSRPEGLYDYSFEDSRSDAGDEIRRGGMIKVASGEGVLDPDGAIRVPITPDLTGLGQGMRYVIEIGARDLTDRSAYASGDFVAYRASMRVGARARLPLGAGADSARMISLSAVCVDSAGRALAGIPLRWRIEKRSYRTVRIRRIGGIYGYENVPVDSVAASGEIASTPARAHIAWIPPGAGLYSFVVSARDARGRETRARDDVYFSGKETAAWYRNDHDWLELKPDRKSYAPGDTARVLIPAPAIPTEGLLIAGDDEIREVRRLPHVSGSPAIPIPLGGVFPPGMWLQTLLIGPPSVPQGMPVVRRLPYYGWGSVQLSVRPDDWKIRVQVETDHTVYRPGDSVAVRIALRDARGAPIAGTATLAVVDDAIFELIDNGEPDPITTFFGYRGQGYSYADIRNDLKLASRGDKGDLSPGGDGSEGAGGLRRRFLPTVHWAPLVPVGADGNAVIRFRLGDDLTRLRFRVLAASGADRFGYAETKASVTKPLQIEWATPRFARQGDRIDAAAVVRGDFDAPTEVRVQAEARGARIEGDRDAKVTVRAGENGRAVFRLSDVRADGIALTLRAEGGGERDGVSTTIPFDRPLLFDREFVAGSATAATAGGAAGSPEFTTPIVTTGTALPDSGGLTVVVSPSMLSGLDDALASVIDYPYGCVEQLSSVILSLAAQRSIQAHLRAPTGPDSTDRARRFDRAVSQIGSAIEPWTLHSWPSTDSPPASDYTAGYALYAVTRAREAGLPVPRALADGLSGEVDRRLQQLFQGVGNAVGKGTLRRGGRGKLRAVGTGNGASRLLDEGPWLLWAQSEADRYRPADSTRARIADAEALGARASDAPLESRMLLALALANLGGRPEAAPLRETWRSRSSSLLDEIRSRDLERTGRFVWIHEIDPRWGDGIGDNVRATAIYLRFLAAADPRDPDLPMVLAWLLSERGPTTGAWANEHVTAIALDAAAWIAGPVEGTLSGVSGTLSIATRTTPFSFDPGGFDPRGSTPGGAGMTPLRLFVPWKDLANKGTCDLRLATDGKSPAYLTATLDRARPALDSPAREEGLIVARRYVDPNGIDLGDHVPLGEPLLVHLAVVVSRDAKTLMIEDPLPGGIEAVNPRFANAPGISISAGSGGNPEAGGAGAGAETEPGMEPGPGTAGPGRLQIVHSEIGDRFVRLFAQDVAAGIYHIYYPAIAATGGMYKVPGARAELLYSPEIYGISAPQTITIERKER